MGTTMHVAGVGPNHAILFKQANGATHAATITALVEDDNGEGNGGIMVKMVMS